MRSHNLAIVRHEFAESGGTMYAIDKSTGETRPISTAVYVICQAAGLLEGYHVELTKRAAECRAMRVRGEIGSRN